MFNNFYILCKKTFEYDILNFDISSCGDRIIITFDN